MEGGVIIFKFVSRFLGVVSAEDEVAREVSGVGLSTISTTGVARGISVASCAKTGATGAMINEKANRNAVSLKKTPSDFFPE